MSREDKNKLVPTRQYMNGFSRIKNRKNRLRQPGLFLKKEETKAVKSGKKMYVDDVERKKVSRRWKLNGGI